MIFDEAFMQILIGSYGALLLLVVSLLVKVLFKINDRQDILDKSLDKHDFIIKDITNDRIPTIRIQIQGLNDRTDDIEYRTDKLEQAIGKND